MLSLIKYVQKSLWQYKQRYIYNFIFIHINKTGGTSIEKALDLFPEHKTAIEKREEVGFERFREKFKFTVVRNPWDKVVSHYFYRLKTNQTNLKENRITFKEWVQLAYEKNDRTYCDNPKMFMPQIAWITDIDGNIIVDRIIRFETLEEGFAEISDHLGRPVSLPHLKASERGAYRNYYDHETMEIVGTFFHNDIELFRYRF